MPKGDAVMCNFSAAFAMLFVCANTIKLRIFLEIKTFIAQ
ncbi:transcriptional regulator LYSR-type [Yersinia aldovae ATCC 35236]|nr:transcriptional regulator LYSR-type [Yersinia aldovae ATCC 35236]